MSKCPVCMYPNLAYPPRDYHICPCCGTEFGNDDAEFSHDQLREMWISAGARWFFGRAPDHWNPWVQLITGGLANWTPKIDMKYPNADFSVRKFFFSERPEFEFAIHA
jgi:hypothetical protein